MNNLKFKDNKEGLKNAHLYLFDEIINLKNISDTIDKTYKAAPYKRDSQMGYRNKFSFAYELYSELYNENYNPEAPKQFTISERGKTRKIDSYKFKDKVVQKLLAQKILLPIINKSCIYDTYACLKGRGITKALDRLSYFLISAKNKYETFAIAKIDIKS